ncbi:MAG: endonuclease/exonuclease/phosphatase family protein [Vicinamibacterales bacterium]
MAIRYAILAGCAGLLAVWFLTVAKAAPAPLVPEIRILTYNIHHGEGSDGVFDLPRLAGVIRSAAPDLVALQEVDEKTERSSGVSQVSELGRLTGLRPVFGEAMPFQGGGYGVAVLSRWPVLAVHNRPLPRLVPEREPRTALSVTVRPAAGFGDVTFTSTHFDFGRGNSRDLQAQAINDMLVGDDETLSILAGDLNSGEDSDVVRIVRRHWREIEVPGPTVMSRSGQLIYRLDWLFVRPASRWRVREARRLEELTASDHLPVLAVLEPVAAN